MPCPITIGKLWKTGRFLLKIPLRAHGSALNYRLVNFIVISKIKLANLFNKTSSNIKHSSSKFGYGMALSGYILDPIFEPKLLSLLSVVSMRGSLGIQTWNWHNSDKKNIFKNHQNSFHNIKHIVKDIYCRLSWEVAEFGCSILIREREDISHNINFC